ncbi:hypothetical protein ACFLV7_10895 [Chloroflexota bacterium]
MGVYDDLSKLDSESPTPKTFGKASNQRNEITIRRKGKNQVNQSTDQPTNRSTNRQTDRLIDWLTNPVTDVDELGPVVERPRAFYITQKLDLWLDEAVRYLKSKGMYKVDRSVLINALLHNEGFYTSSFLNTIRRRLLAHLTNKSLKRVQSTD